MLLFCAHEGATKKARHLPIIPPLISLLSLHSNHLPQESTRRTCQIQRLTRPRTRIHHHSQAQIRQTPTLRKTCQTGSLRHPTPQGQGWIRQMRGGVGGAAHDPGAGCGAVTGESVRGGDGEGWLDDHDGGC